MLDASYERVPKGLFEAFFGEGSMGGAETRIKMGDRWAVGKFEPDGDGNLKFTGRYEDEE